MNREKKITNTPDLANFPKGDAIPTDSASRLPGSDPLFWLKVRNDIVILAKIIKNGDKEDKPEELSFLSKR